MSKKIIILIIIILVLTAGAVGFYFYKKSNGTPGEEGFFSRLFPAAGEREIKGGGGQEALPPSGENILKEPLAAKILTQLTKSAVSGAAFASTTIRYIEKSTGHIYEIEPNGENKQRISNTTILKTFESFWSADANKLILRYFEEDGADLNVRNFSSFIATTTALQGIFLPAQISALAVSPAEDKIFYLVPAGDAVNGITSDFENKKQNNIFSLSFGEFNVSWPNKDKIVLLTKPSFDIEGFFYFLDSKTGKFEKIIGGIKGLMAIVSSDAGKLIYSQSINNGVETKNFNIKDKTVKSLGVNTLPEKCVWSKVDKDIVYCGAPKSFPVADYPDAWYQGLVSFSDSIWRLNLSTGEAVIMNNEIDSDIINPFLSKTEDYLIFTDKKNLTLWSLKLK